MLPVNWDKITLLTSMSTYKPDDDRLIYIDNNWNEFTEAEYDLIMANLYNNLLDPIAFGFGYDQGDIKRHLRKIL